MTSAGMARAVAGGGAARGAAGGGAARGGAARRVAGAGAARGLRDELAAATRMLAALGLLGYSGHLSARLGEDAFLVQPFDADRALLTADELLEVRGGRSDGRPVAELELHRQVLLERPDVGAVAHLHHDRATAFTLAAGAALAPFRNHAARWRSGLPVHADATHIVTAAQGAAVARTLGAHNGLQLRGHGQVLVAEDVPSVFADAVHFAENVEVAIVVAGLGPAQPLTDAELDAFEATFNRPRHVRKLWAHYVNRTASPV
jgi:ribulose-5-phosphate 4-epimerase/fuculose-1-phosphate aldolase